MPKLPVYWDTELRRLEYRDRGTWRRLGLAFNTGGGGGGGGVTDHDDLDASSLVWTSSDHTGDPLSVAAFDASGDAAYLAITDFQTQDDDLDALSAIAGTGLVVRIDDSPETYGTRAVTVDAGSSAYASWANGDGVGGDPALTIVPSSIVRDGWKAPPRIDFTGRAIEWMSTITSNPGTATRASNTVAACSLHFEEQPSATYDAILPSTTSASASGSTITLAIYALDATSKRPGALLWYSGTITASNANVDHTVTFASGTWTAAGAAYKDGSNRLRLTAGQAVWKGAWGSASVQWRTITETTARAIGFVTPVTTSSKFLGVDLPSLTYPTWPDPAPTGNNANSVGVIALPLRWV